MILSSALTNSPTLALIIWAVLAVVLIAVSYLVLRPQPKPPPGLTQLASVILQQNNMQAYWKVPGVVEWPIPVEGGMIHKIVAAQATQIGATITQTIPKPIIPILCGLFSSESVMDPQCVNQNWNGSNPERDPWKADCGIAQLKLIDIEVAGKKYPDAFASASDAQAFAFDVTKAIPYAYGLYQAHLAEADNLIAGNTRSDVDQRLMNRYVLAAIIYKQGPTGGATIFQAGTWPNELNNFANLVTWYSQQLGIPSLI